jgi:hypothetical protein
MRSEFWWGNVKERDNLEYLRILGMILSKDTGRWRVWWLWGDVVD